MNGGHGIGGEGLRPANPRPGGAEIGGAKRPDEARQSDRNAVLGPAGSQAGGFPALGGGGRGVGVLLP